jgi:ATP-binding cassette subfamily C protein/ATP-binding cassette subfamily C exporter for protease/lipase/ATP-binding cassette subfamily C protein EexD
MAIEEHPAPPRRTTLPSPDGRVVVEGVSYLTPNTAQLIISEVSCAVEPGEALAIIGPSGAGKSTLCRLMVGLAVPNVGEIRLDGSQIHHWDGQQIGQHIGFLPQDVELFAGTVRDNIARMQLVDDQAIVKAARLAYAHEMIQHFPQGYDTRIGDGGVRLSGGQRQRIGLARAVFGNPRFIVLDEPNANLDQAGEAALAEAIENLKQSGVALIIVGHRPSTLSIATKILFLKEGRVVLFGERDHVLETLKARSAEPLAQNDDQKGRRRLSPGNGANGLDHNAKAMAGAS